MPLPKGVEIVRAKGRTYYYWNPHRGTDREGDRTTLNGDPLAPPGNPEYARFHRELSAAAAKTKINPKGSLAAFVDAYRDSDEFKRLADSTQAGYNVSLNRFSDHSGWGLFGPDDLTPAAVLAARDDMKDAPYAANEQLSVGRTLYRWGIPLRYASQNPFDAVGPLETPDAGHVPWPRWAVEYVLEKAWPDIVRMVRIGIMTCQRESDLVRMGPQHREDNGIWCRPKKTRKRRRSFRIPLLAVDALELDRWAETAMTFTAARWKAPIARHREDLFLYSPKGAPYNPTNLRARYNRWLNLTPEGVELRKRWRAWLEGQIDRYEWEIDPDDWRHPTIHGLRGTGILSRFAQGYDVAQISNDVGMSAQMVEHYMRFKDQVDVASGGRARLKIVT